MKRWSNILSLLLILSLTGVAMACPMCKDSIPASDAKSAGSLPGGFNFSVYYMLIGLFSVMGLVGWVIVKGVRSTNAGGTYRRDPSAPADRSPQ